MAEATETELRNMLSGLVGVSSDTISLYLADAKAKIVDHGIAVAHPRFSELQRYMTAHLMSIEGVGVSSGKITAEKVADVGINYADNSGSSLGSLYSTDWAKEYQKARNQIQGLEPRCL
jgi:hypothetical protein